MPEHVHVVLFPTTAEYDVGDILTAIKQPVARAAASFVRKHAPEFRIHMEHFQPNGNVTLRFWQRGGGDDRNLWSPDKIWEKIDYVHNNPIRRKLCEKPHEWDWSRAADYAGLRDGPIRLSREHLPRRPM